jgi:hypothetical protein
MKEYKRTEEEEKIMKARKDSGIKFDDGKIRYDLIAPRSLDELAKVYTYGCKKYDDNNWRGGFKWGRLFGAMMRHAWAWYRGETYDQESGLHHLAHAAWQCFALMEFEWNKRGEDDRHSDAMDLKK